MTTPPAMCRGKDAPMPVDRIGGTSVGRSGRRLGMRCVVRVAVCDGVQGVPLLDGAAPRGLADGRLLHGAVLDGAVTAANSPPGILASVHITASTGGPTEAAQRAQRRCGLWRICDFYA